MSENNKNLLCCLKQDSKNKSYLYQDLVFHDKSSLQELQFVVIGSYCSPLLYLFMILVILGLLLILLFSWLSYVKRR